ncbi:RDD family protein [Flavobacterium okayamense]|uniref:RDD domain-containing protein n=1 Tax=Flavobacterium okayamense TaxID=2830782 RepID=A0ABM7S7V3_9FLAO|nr:RDD family protein [Flavobacterium okayamense]BCY28794.1 hypothetical protein KK2020170_16620 [Flavobacterium okayamense]
MNENILGKRIGACIVDYFILFIAFFILSFIYLLFSGVFKFQIKNIEIILLLVLWFFLLVFPEYKFGKTIGKKIIGLKVISEDKSKISFSQSLIRRAFDVIDIFVLGIISLIILSNKSNNQRFGDKVAKTHVLNDSK